MLLESGEHFGKCEPSAVDKLKPAAPRKQSHTYNHIALATAANDKCDNGRWSMLPMTMQGCASGGPVLRCALARKRVWYSCLYWRENVLSNAANVNSDGVNEGIRKRAKE